MKSKEIGKSSISNLIIDNKSGVQKQNTTDDFLFLTNQVNPTKLFYTFELLFLSLSLSNNTACYLSNQSSIELLICNCLLITFIFLLSILFFKLEKKSKSFQKISQPLLFFMGGLGMIIIDPEIFGVLVGKPFESYFPTLLQLILITVLQSSFKTSVNLNSISLFLGILSLALNISGTRKIPQSVYLFIVLCICCLKFGYGRNKTFQVVGSNDKYELDDSPISLDFVEIIDSLQKSIESLTNNINNKKAANLKKILKNLQSISISLKKNQNIYTSRIENITKNMDDQDRLFIEQSCYMSLANIAGSNRDIKLKENSEFIYGVSELMGALSLVGKDWNFNTFFIDQCSDNEAVQVIGFYSIRRYGLDDMCKISEEVIKSFLKKLESSYRPNPYHNSAHAADVLCSYMYLINNSDLYKHISSIELLAGIIATLGHDAGHPGRTNRFLILTRDDIAIAYNDSSILENMHTSIIFNILKQKECDILQNLTNEKWMAVRKCVIEMILATDMAKHFDMMAQLRVKYHELEVVDLEKVDVRYDVFRLVMKAADIGHAAKAIDLHEKWCRLVVEEFYGQGDLEKEIGIPVSMYCDRETTDISKSQAGFIKNIVYPLFVTLNGILVSTQIDEACLSQLRTNELYWTMRRKTIRGQSLIFKQEDYVNTLNNLTERRRTIRKPSLPERSGNNS